MKDKRNIKITATALAFVGFVIVGIVFYSGQKPLPRSGANLHKQTISKPNLNINATYSQEQSVSTASVPLPTHSDNLDFNNITTTNETILCELEELNPKLPTQFKNIAKLINMEPNNFGKSPNEIIQKLIDEHNSDMSSLPHIKCSGLCTWNAAWGHSNPFKLDLTRKRFNVVCQCGQESIEVKNGTALFSDKIDQDCLDIYYLFAFAMFDPKNYTQISNESIEVPTEHQQESKDVYAAISETKILYFDRKDSQLIRVGLKQTGDDNCYAYIDFLKHQTLSGKRIPTKIQVTFTNAAKMRSNNTFVPEQMVLEITPDTIEF